MNRLRGLLTITLLCWLSGCYTVRKQPALPAGAIKPQTNGYFSYVKANTLKGVTMPEITRAARNWIMLHSRENAFKWQSPVYKAEQLYAGRFRPETIPVSDSEYYASQTVHYLLTVSAKRGAYRLTLTTFEVTGVQPEKVGLEKLVSDQALCRAVEVEAGAMLQAMKNYIDQTAQKSL